MKLHVSGHERPQLSKETVKSAMEGRKRLDEVTPNIVLNEEIMDHYHQVNMIDY